MSDPARELEQLDKREERLDRERDDAWDRMNACKGRLQQIETDLRSDTPASVRYSLEKEQASVRVDYMRADRAVHDIDKERLEMGLRYQALGVGSPDKIEELLDRKNYLVDKYHESFERLQDMRAEKSVIGTNHYILEMDLIKKEISIIVKKLGEPPFMGMSQGSDEGPALDPAMKKGRDFEPEL